MFVCMYARSLSPIQLFAIPWTVSCQALLSMEFSRQEYWSELPIPPPRDLPEPWMEPKSPALAGRFFTTKSPGKPLSESVNQNKWGKKGLRPTLNPE